MKSRKQYLREADKQLKSILEASRFEMTPDKKELVRLRQELSAYKSANKAMKDRADRFEKDAEATLNKLMSGKLVKRTELDKLEDHWDYIQKMNKLFREALDRVVDGISDTADSL